MAPYSPAAIADILFQRDNRKNCKNKEKCLCDCFSRHADKARPLSRAVDELRRNGFSQQQQTMFRKVLQSEIRGAIKRTVYHHAENTEEKIRAGRPQWSIDYFLGFKFAIEAGRTLPDRALEDDLYDRVVNRLSAMAEQKPDLFEADGMKEKRSVPLDQMKNGV